jgi:hypothetical protein
MGLAKTKSRFSALLFNGSKKRTACKAVRGRMSRIESLEQRELFAIDWVNEASSGFAAAYGATNGAIATELVHRAIQDWETFLTDFNYDNDNNPATVNGLNNTFSLSLSASSLLPGVRGGTSAILDDANGRPYQATVLIDDNGGGSGWFFDQTPWDDAEFTAIANSMGPSSSFQASFVDVTTGGTHYNDIYRAIVHEIGHALGIHLTPGDRLYNLTTAAGTDFYDGTASLRQFSGSGYTATLTTNGGGHLYEGAPGTPVHANELMNPERTMPSGGSPISTTRQFISDLDVKLLRDAYGYGVVMPSTVNTANVTLDSLTGTLLVQGRLGNQNDTITIDTILNSLRVDVNGATELVPLNAVSQILIAENGGTDVVSVSGVAMPWTKAQYVVSSNEDRTDNGIVGDGLVDLNSTAPGWETSLRAAIQDANARPNGTPRIIYVPRGKYSLTISGPAGISQGDLDILRTVTIVGTGAGETVVDASGLWSTSSDRVFDVAFGGVLSLYALTVTGGRAPNIVGEHGGAINVRSGGTLVSGQLVVAGNQTTHSGANGGGIYFADGAGGVISTTVVTNNYTNNYTGGIFLAANVLSSGVSLTSSIVAKNSAPNRPLLTDGPDVLAQPGRTFTTGGNNRLGNATTGFTNGVSGDYISTAVDYIVTGVADTYNVANDNHVLSMREAVKKSNDLAGTQEIWTPAWNYFLTRVRDTTPGSTDIDELYGDLDIKGSTVIRGVSGQTNFYWMPGTPTDVVFDMIGDFDGDGLGNGSDDGDVDGVDFLVLQSTLGSTTDLRADADDDGDVDSNDQALWNAYFGNQLTLLGV